MSFVETEINGQIITIRLNRPERLNALSTVIRKGMAEAFNRFHEDKDLEVAILTGTGRGFCAGEDMKESLDTGNQVAAFKLLGSGARHLPTKELLEEFNENNLNT